LLRKVHVLRIKPKREVLTEVTRYCHESGIVSAVIIGIIGSMEKARLNYLMSLPGKHESVDYAGPLEIDCAQGSVALKKENPIVHIHISLSKQGLCRGSHLAEAVVFSTAEVVIGELDHQLRRELDDYTGLNESTG
jgi:predicted DNA-binding protein with PD1-like motif